MTSNQPVDWEEIQLGELFTAHYGKSLTQKNRVPGKYKVYGSSGITGTHNEFLVKGPGLIIGRKGTIGNVYYEKNSFYPIDTTYYVKESNRYDLLFLYYKLKTLDLDKMNTHSAVPGLNREQLYSIKTKFPKITEQKAIANILSSFDEKIEINNQINKKLEEMAQAIFKHWFVDFEFPNENSEPYKSSGGEMVESELGLIPKGWKVTKIGDVTKIVRGASPRPIQSYLSNTGMPWVKISDASESNTKYIYKTKEFIKNEGISKSRVVLPGTLILSNSATPGIPKFMLIKACVHDGWLIFNDYKDISKEYLYYCLIREREGILSLSNGSVFRNLKTDILKNYKIIIPDNKVLNKIQNYFFTTNKEIEKRTIENEVLKNIRDTLLPKLMSGEIRVPVEEEK